MTTNKIAVIGSSSMVGSRFVELYEKKHKEVIVKGDLKGNHVLDITNRESTEDFFTLDFQTAVLFSAYTDVDGAQLQKGDKNGPCWQINVIGARNVAQSAKKHNKKLAIISTDFVFDGENGPYSEEILPANSDSLSWYGYTKLKAENIVRKLETSLVIRISYPYRSKFKMKDDIAKTILKKYQKNDLYPMFDDQIMTPTFIDDLVPAISLFIKNNSTGTYHVASPTSTTPYNFAKKLLEKFTGEAENLKKGSIKEFVKKAGSTPRPIKGGLKVEKIIELGFSPTNWEEGISKIYSQSQGKLI